MNQTSPQTDEHTDVPAHRSPHSFEVVSPKADKVDGRSLPENIAKRVSAHQAGAALNRQLFANSSLATDEVTEAWRNDPDRLFNDKEPNLAIIHEKPEHRVAIYLKAQGLSDKEICGRLGYTQPWFSQLKRQPWFKLRLVQELRDAGKDAIAEIVKGAAADSVFKLIELRDNNKAPFAVQKAAADSLLDRFLGKAIQKVETKDVSLPSTPEIRKVEEEIASIDKQLQTPTQSTNADAVAEPQPPNEKPQT